MVFDTRFFLYTCLVPLYDINQIFVKSSKNLPNFFTVASLRARHSASTSKLRVPLQVPPFCKTWNIKDLYHSRKCDCGNPESQYFSCIKSLISPITKQFLLV